MDPALPESPLNTLRLQARGLYHRVVREYKARARLNDPEAPWWYRLAQPLGKLAYREPAQWPVALRELESLRARLGRARAWQKAYPLARRMIAESPAPSAAH